MPEPEIELLVHDAGQLVTFEGRTGLRGSAMSQPKVLERASVAVQDGRIVEIGSATELAGRHPHAPRVDLGGRGVLTPGLVDPHTHAVHAGNRAAEFARRIAGATYREIAESGGGILHTVRSTRARTMEELADGARGRLASMRETGTTTVEIKSGYALETGAELRMLGAIDILAAEEPMTVVPTFMGAHEVPPEFRSDKARYLDILVEEMIPAASEQGIARYCDVFCEAHVFTTDESRRILEAARSAGLGLKIHADELEPTGGAELAAELGAASADHLGCISDAGIAALAASDTVAVLLPGTTFFLDLQLRAPARRLIEAGAIVALATDSNPGSSNTTNLPLILSLACIQLRMTPTEALCAATQNAAAAIGLGSEKGTLEAGKDADMVLWDAEDHCEIPYRYGTCLTRAVWRGGQLVLDRRNPRPAACET